MNKQKERDFSVDGSKLIFHMNTLESVEFAKKTAAMVPSLLDVYPTITLDMSAVRSIKPCFADVFFGMISGEHMSNGRVQYLLHDGAIAELAPVIQTTIRRFTPASFGGTAQIH